MNIKEALELIDENTFIISDLHLNHKNILLFEPIRNTQMRIDGFDNHEEWVIHNWNSVISENDVVLCLGDFAFSGVSEYAKQLNGIKIMVLGNHDAPPKQHKWKNGNIFVIDGLYLYNESLITRAVHDDDMMSGFIKEINNKKCLFSHYPVFDSDEYDRRNPNIKPRIEFLENVYKLQDCDLSIHGHTHSNNSKFTSAINVSFEALNFKPTKLKDIF
jgi:calcineurin-like phosphoesterase family protein